MKDCINITLDVEKLIRYVGDSSRRYSGLLQWTDNNIDKVHLLARYWFWPAHLGLAPSLELEFFVHSRDILLPVNLWTEPDKFRELYWWFVCPACRIQSSEEQWENHVDKLYLTYDHRRKNWYFGCRSCHIHHCMGHLKSSLSVLNSQREWDLPETWGSGAFDYWKLVTGSNATALQTMTRIRERVSRTGVSETLTEEQIEELRRLDKSR